MMSSCTETKKKTLYCIYVTRRQYYNVLQSINQIVHNPPMHYVCIIY